MTALTTVHADLDFGAGPIAVTAEHDILSLETDDRLLVTFNDCEVLFTVNGRARGALHLGAYLTPFEYVHWRLESRQAGWYLITADRTVIERLRRFYRLR